MQEHLLSPYSSIQCTRHGRVRPRQAGLQELGSVRQPAHEPARGARDLLRHVLLRGRRPLLRGRRGDRAAGCRTGRGSSASALPTGLDIGNEAPSWQTVVPTPAWRKKTFKSDWDKAWNPGDSIQLAIGQKDITVTPLQMARFYAMIANGGKLVTPYVVADVEQPGSDRQEPVTLQQFPPDPPRDAGVDPAALAGRARRPLGRDALAERHLVGRLRHLPDLDLRQDRHGREGRQPARLSGRPPRGPVVVVRLRALRRRPARRLRRDRERRPRLLGRRARRARGLRAVLPSQGRPPSPW